MKQERIGEFFALSSGVLHGLFPILINYSVGFIPAIFYAGMTNLLAAVLFLLYLFFYKKNPLRLNGRIWIYIVIVSFFIVILPSLFIFVGTKYTSSINTAILSQAEILFTFIFCGLFFGEIITRQKILGGLVIVLGAIAVLYNGNFIFNKGDLLIIVGTMFYPIGNHYAKKALAETSAGVVLLFRSIMGGLGLLAISFLLEGTGPLTLTITTNNFFYIAVNSFLIVFVAKIVWYEALKRLDVSKAIPIISASPAFSLLFAVAFLGEIPSVYQLIGLITIMLGLWFMTKRPHEHAPSL